MDKVGEKKMKWTKEKIEELIREGTLYRFYKSKEWQQIKEKILKENHNECQWCRERGKIARAETVHHVQHVKKHPELALSRYYTYKGQQYENLIPLCHDCHDKAHERMRYKPKAREVTKERW